MPDRPLRRAVITFHEVAERQMSEMDDAALERLSPHLDIIALNPKTAGVQMRPDSPVLEYAKDGVRVAYVSTVLGTIVLVAYVEVG
ncbi:hypothetical protein GCM10010441_40170 [Kitasatospora paracochleata]|uniref:DUF4258 domain-containing protein n=1 Tax=Kitasatospora paracochleata TaxID=58354 RepID=A0ABT1IVV0_9ACTN|nr:hypothetical protein [Kitasatospora paracochleata]MCP2309264.1 hypothetical protein [Kitasatospora paracochleata]